MLEVKLLIAILIIFIIDLYLCEHIMGSKKDALIFLFVIALTGIIIILGFSLLVSVR